MLTSIGGTGRATPTMRDGKISVSWDHGRNQTATQMFSPRNVISFSAEKSFKPLPHALRVSYVEPDLDWQQGERIVYMNGYNANGANGKKAATFFEDLSLWGVTDRAQAWREGRYVLEQGRLRPETYTVVCDFEHLICTRGDKVLLAFDEILAGGQASRVLDVVNVGADVIITLDERHGAAAGDQATIRQTGGKFASYLISDTPDSNSIRFPGSVNVKQGDLVVIGPPGQTTRGGMIRSIDVTSDFQATLTIVDWNEALYDHESEGIPPYNPGITDFQPGIPPAVRKLSAAQTIIFEGRQPEALITLNWDDRAGPAASGYAIWWRDSDLGRWIQVGTALGKRIEVRYRWYLAERTPDGQDWQRGDYTGETLRFRVQPIGIGGDRAPIRKAAEVSITLKGDTQRPGDVPRLDASARDRGLLLEWDEVEDEDVVAYQVRWSHRFDADWRSMTPVVTTNSYDTRQAYVAAREGLYAVKAIDSSGNRSRNHTRAVIDYQFDDSYDIWRTVDFSAGGWLANGAGNGVIEHDFGAGLSGLTLGTVGGGGPVGAGNWSPASTGAATPAPAGWTSGGVGTPAAALPTGYVQASVSPFAFSPDQLFIPTGTYEYGSAIDLGAFVEDLRLVVRIDAQGVAMVATGDDITDLWDVRVYVSTADNLPVLANWLALDDGSGNIPIDFDSDGNPDYMMPAIYDPAAGVWSEWVPINATDLRGRLLRFKVELISHNPLIAPVIRSIEIDIDLPDRQESGEVSVGTTWVTVPFKNSFFAPPLLGGVRPKVNVTAGNIVGGGFPETRNQNRDGFQVRMSAGTADIDWVAQGYGRIS